MLQIAFFRQKLKDGQNMTFTTDLETFLAVDHLDGTILNPPELQMRLRRVREGSGLGIAEEDGGRDEF